MGRLLLLAPMIAGLLLVTGCGSTDESTPVACLEGPAVYLRALGEAPATVKLQGETSISECLAENQPAGELAGVGGTLVTATTHLNAEARAEPGGPANVELGYLLGAAQRGASRTEGIHAELIRRLSIAARYSPDNRPLPATFLDAYRRGFDAGEARG
jgi:hypothetical protein